jgi:hypothetical protein
MLVAATPTPVVALEAPTGVLFDSRVTVVVVASSGPDSGSEMAVAEASVTLVATALDGTSQTPVGEPVTGLTGDDGSVELRGVARPAGAGSSDVRLAVDAFRRIESTDADGCTRTEVWAGDVAGIVAPPPDPIVVRAERVVTTACPTGPTLEGRLLDSTGDPLVVADASIEVAAPDTASVTIPVAVGADGSFLAELPAVGTWTEPATVTLRATGAATRTAVFGQGCVRTLAEAVIWSQAAALAEGGTLPVVELKATEQVIAERCGAVATPPPASPVGTGGGATGGTTGGTTGGAKGRATGGATDAATPRPRIASPDPTATPTATPGRTAAERTPRTGAVAGRTGVPAPDEAIAPRTTAAGPGVSTTTPEMVALLVALVAMAVTLAIVVRIRRRA